MSHITRLNLAIKSLDDLEVAGAHIGLIFRRGVTTARGYDDHRCDHVLRMAGARHGAYEVGVVADGENWRLEADLGMSGSDGGLRALVGPNAERLLQEYAIAVSTRHLFNEGYAVTRHPLDDGTIRLEATATDSPEQEWQTGGSL